MDGCAAKKDGPRRRTILGVNMELEPVSRPFKTTLAVPALSGPGAMVAASTSIPVRVSVGWPAVIMPLVGRPPIPAVMAMGWLLFMIMT